MGVITVVIVAAVIMMGVALSYNNDNDPPNIDPYYTVKLTNLGVVGEYGIDGTLLDEGNRLALMADLYPEADGFTNTRTLYGVAGYWSVTVEFYNLGSEPYNIVMGFESADLLTYKVYVVPTLQDTIITADADGRFTLTYTMQAGNWTPGQAFIFGFGAPK